MSSSQSNTAISLVYAKHDSWIMGDVKTGLPERGLSAGFDTSGWGAIDYNRAMTRAAILPALALALTGTLWTAPADSEARAAAEAKQLAAFLAELPPAQMPALTEQQALAMVAMPLSCVDHPQALPELRGDYLWVHDTKPHMVEAYNKNRAFYGCFDWHSAVNSTWTMVAVLKQFPNIPVGRLIQEKLKDHLDKKNIEGEMEFFKSAKNFEVPYGYAWLLKLYAELLGWDNPEARKYAGNLAPLVQQFSKKLVGYLNDLPFPTRAGMHPNTAFSLGLLFDYSEAVSDPPLREAAVKTANRFFLEDKSCPTAYEPGGTEFLSPCLAEARLMSRVLDRGRVAQWLTDFLPAAYSATFKPLTVPVDVTGITKEEQLAGKSHLIGLAFQRAEAMMGIADALPPDDPRVPVLTRLAAINANSGFKALADAGYFGSHWLATYAVMCSRAVAGK
jgi:hypothetical protein